jgi:hypothetical protein
VIPNIFDIGFLLLLFSLPSILNVIHRARLGVVYLKSVVAERSLEMVVERYRTHCAVTDTAISVLQIM